MKQIILTAEDDDGYGYIVFHDDTTSMVYVMYWAKNTETKSECFLNKEYLYEKSCLHVQSDLVDISPLHHAKYRMCKAFI